LYGWTGELLPDDHRPESLQSTRAVFFKKTRLTQA
jgi:hypothetical protein